jgi:hypothetical protein
MTDTEAKITRLENAIAVLQMHLNFELNPDKYSLPKTYEKRQQGITWLENRIDSKQEEIEKLKLQ